MVTHRSLADVGNLLNHFSDVLEGGNAYASGSSYDGVPAKYSNDPELRAGDYTDVTTTSTVSTTVLAYSTGDWPSTRWEKTDIPGYFAVCTSATNIANEGAARRITGWNNTTKRFTVDAFPASVTVDDTFEILQGFKRIPNSVDIEAVGIEAGYDRFFRFDVESEGADLGFYGKGIASYKTQLQLRVRLLKYGRDTDMRSAAFTVMKDLRQAIIDPDNRDGTYVRAVTFEGSSDIIKDDLHKIVVLQRFSLIYRSETTAL